MAEEEEEEVRVGVALHNVQAQIEPPSVQGDRAPAELALAATNNVGENQDEYLFSYTI